ncbi:MAG TPA: hypothetical protein EYG57_06625 [Planctomycetes bacterium]|nr:hypothetical protein [Planctomycetaceae bacterium]HIM29214.1 hypothetical protein [Planctomycetota bacterium]
MIRVNEALCAVTLGAFLLPGVAANADVAIAGGQVIQLEKTLSDVRNLWVTPEDFTRINGFEVKPEGACHEDICIPLRQDADGDLFVKRDGQSWLNATMFADKVQQSYVVDRESGVWSFGMVPSSRKAFLDSAVAPDFELVDRNGDTVKLSNFRGKKVLIITWASW